MLKDIPSDERKNLIVTINANGGFRGRKLPHNNPFNELELVGILEYGDPRVFEQQEFSYESNFRDENDSVHHTHSTLCFSHINVQRDLTLATQLGGYAMRNRIQKVTGHKSDSRRRKKLYYILQNMPERYRSVRDHIIQYDLDKLTTLCAGYKSDTVRKICVVMVQDRAISLGMYPPRDELLKIFDVEKTGLMKIKGALKAASMLGNSDRRIDTMKNAALNLLIQLRDIGVIGKVQSLKAQSRISELDQFPKLFNGSKHMDLVVALSALMIDQPDLDLSGITGEIGDFRSEDPIKCYQAMKRAMGRSVDYVEYINSPMDIQTPVIGVVVDPIPSLDIGQVQSVRAEPVPETIKETVDEYPVEIFEEDPIDVEEISDTFEISWQSSGEIIISTWYSSDTFSNDTMEWYTQDISDSNMVKIKRYSRRFLYQNNYLILKLMRSDQHWDGSLLPKLNAHEIIHGKGPPILLNIP